MLGVVCGEGISGFTRMEAGDFKLSWAFWGSSRLREGALGEVLLTDWGKPQILVVLTELSSQLCLRRQRLRQRR